MQNIYFILSIQYLWVRLLWGYKPRTSDMALHRTGRTKSGEHHPCGICFTHHLTEKLHFIWSISQSISEDLSLFATVEILVRWYYSHMANLCYHDLGSTRAWTITRECVLVNMCHIKFALTGRKEGSEDRNAVGINVELGSPFLQGISCLVERWGPDRELWHSALSPLGILQLNTHMFSSTPSVCVSVSYQPDHTSTLLPQIEQVPLKYSKNSHAYCDWFQKRYHKGHL